MLEPYYENHAVRLYHGDCREILPQLPSQCAHLLLTDPPYGMTYVNKTGRAIKGDAERQGIRLFRSVLLELQRILAEPSHAYVFCHWESWPDFYDAVACYWPVKNALVWHKDNGGTGDCLADYAHDYELVLFAHKGGRRPLEGRRDGSVLRHLPISGHKRSHPTEKPTEVLGYYIRKSAEPSELVLDPFVGSGATLVAAQLEGRQAIGIELVEEYCELAAKRLSNEQGVLL